MAELHYCKRVSVGAAICREDLSLPVAGRRGYIVCVCCMDHCSSCRLCDAGVLQHRSTTTVPQRTSVRAVAMLSWRLRPAAACSALACRTCAVCHHSRLNALQHRTQTVWNIQLCASGPLYTCKVVCITMSDYPWCRLPRIWCTVRASQQVRWRDVQDATAAGVLPAA